MDWGLWWLTVEKSPYVRPHRFHVQLHAIVTQFRFFTVAFQLHKHDCHKKHMNANARRIRPTCRKKTEHTTLLNKQKTCTVCVFKCWLNCQLASFEALLSCRLKKSQRPNAIVERSPFFVSCRTQKQYPSKLRNLLCLLVSHRTNLSGKRILVVTERCIFFGTGKGPQRTSPEGRTGSVEEIRCPRSCCTKWKKNGTSSATYRKDETSEAPSTTVTTCGEEDS